MGEYLNILTYNALSYMAHIKEISKSHLAYYHMKKKRITKGAAKRAITWKVTTMGDLSIIIKGRKPQFVLKKEYKMLLKELEDSGKGLTQVDLDRVIKKRNLPLLDKEPPCTKVKVKL